MTPFVSISFFPLSRHPAGHLLAALALVLALASVGRSAPPAPPYDITVSAANYAEGPPAVLAKLFRHPTDQVDAPPPPPPASARPVHYYQFLPSESLEADLSMAEVCKLLVAPLAAKNLLNTTVPAKADLILRVTFGGRQWRDPIVRENDLTWKSGLVPKKRNTSFGAVEAWDERAGGNEDALREVESELMSVDASAAGMADGLIDGRYTEDYYLIVVDAFDIATLRKKGNDTPRLWSTFIAVPAHAGVKFSDVAAKMILKAAPYFAETLPGKAIFTDREGTVHVGQPQVIEDPKTPAQK